MSHDNLATAPIWGERAAVLADIIRWRGGGCGYCEAAGCEMYERRRPVWLNLVEAPRYAYRLSLIAPRTRAAEVALEAYLAGAMRTQLRRKGDEPHVKRLCMSCALQLVEEYDLTTETARKLSALRARSDGVSLCFIAMQAGTGIFPRFVVSGATARPLDDATKLA
jgi:hypothetical protein